MDLTNDVFLRGERRLFSFIIIIYTNHNWGCHYLSSNN